MSTTITPSTGNGALFTQQGAGTTPGYSAIDDRRAGSTGLQEGVDAATDWMVVQRGAGSNNSCDITLATGFARVQGDTVAGQGLYTVAPHSATINETITAADVTNPRVDQVVLEVLDNVIDASGSSLARTRIVAGSPQPGATLVNRTGAAALPNSCLRLADLLIPANAGGTVTLANSQIRDRRTWARGAYVRIVLATGGNKTTTSTTLTALDATNLNPRMECSGGPLRVSLGGVLNSAATGTLGLAVFVDGAQTDGIGTGGELVGYSGGAQAPAPALPPVVPAAGSHQIGVGWLSSSGSTVTAFCATASPLILTVEELVRQNTANNSVTTG